MNATRRHHPQQRRGGFVLLLVLTLLAVVTGLGAVLTLHTGQLARFDRARSLNIALDQMIDSGVAYAHLHRDDWPNADGAVVLDATGLTNSPRTAQITLEPTVDPNGAVKGVTVTATLRLARGNTRSQAMRVPLLANGGLVSGE